MDPDFWIETISYKETRDYVARVLAFSVIYDWRMDGDALPVSQRLRGQSGDTRKKFACPLAEAPKRSEKHTSELQSLMRNSYAGFSLKKKKYNTITTR